MNKFYLVIILFHAAGFIYSQDTSNTKNYLLGDYDVTIHSSCYNDCTAPVSFINLHDDENTAVEAAVFYMEYNGGQLMQLKHGYGRNICFNLSGQGYTFDPNRIFTPEGIKATLDNLGDYSANADTLITAFAGEIIKNFVDNKRLLITLHNNTDNMFSILSYTKGKWEEKNALNVFINPNMDPDDFVYTTEPGIFDTLVSKEINVVLQNNLTAIDDGSLSVYASRNNIPYINVEAEAEHLDEQIRMLEALINIIKDYSSNH